MSTHSEITDLKSDLRRRIDRLKKMKGNAAEVTAAALEDLLVTLRAFESIARAELQEEERLIKGRRAEQALDAKLHPPKKRDWNPHDV